MRHSGFAAPSTTSPLTLARLAATAAAALALAWFSDLAMAQSIYTCVDGKGRKITSDRPIAECTDRAQQEMSATGTVKRVLGPSLTAQERAALEDKEKQAAETRARELEDKRRDRALLLRYPNRKVHDNERALALTQIDEVILASSKRTVQLSEQRKLIDSELEFYKNDVAKAPLSVKRRVEENDSGVAVQKRFIADQELEKKRVNMRFDEELIKLKQLWGMASAPIGSGPVGVAPAASAARIAAKK